ncbi:MAG: hypothetical protein ACFB51_08695 [Anaerolineae bacterium]
MIDLQPGERVHFRYTAITMEGEQVTVSGAGTFLYEYRAGLHDQPAMLALRTDDGQRLIISARKLVARDAPELGGARRPSPGQGRAPMLGGSRRLGPPD